MPRTQTPRPAMSRLSGLAAACLLLAAPAGAQDLAAAFDGAPDWLAEAYEARGYEPVWSDGDRPSAAFGALVRAIEDAEARGLDTAMYAPDSVRRLARESAAVREQGAALIFARFAQDLLEGRTSPEIDYQPDFAQRRDRAKADILAAAYREGPMR